MARAKLIRILLVQAGGTAWDAESRLGGRADLPMREDERARLARPDPVVSGLVASEEWRASLTPVLCAPDEASVETARILAAGLPGGGRVRESEKLAELDMGLWEGVRAEDLEGRCPRAFGQWREDPGSVTPPQGEALAAAEDRVLSEITRAVDRSKDAEAQVAVVLRPVTYAMVRCWLEGVPTRRMVGVMQEGAHGAGVWTIARERLEREDRVGQRSAAAP